MKKCVLLTSKSAYPWRGTQNYLNVRIFNRQPALDLIRLPEAIELRKPSQDCPVRACGDDSWTRTNDPIDVNDVLCPCGRVIKQIRMSGHPSEALEIRAFSIFGGVQRWGVFKGVQRGVHEDEHGGVQGVFTVRSVHPSL